MYSHSPSSLRLTQIKFTTKKINRPRNGLEDVILKEEADSSGIRQRINKTRVSTISEINNDNAAKDHNHTTKYVNNRTE